MQHYMNANVFAKYREFVTELQLYRDDIGDDSDISSWNHRAPMVISNSSNLYTDLTWFACLPGHNCSIKFL